MSDPNDESDDLQTPLVAPTGTVLYSEEYSPPWVALTLFLMPLFWKYHVVVTEESLSFGYYYACVETTTPRTQVVAAEPCQIHPLRQWGGWGIRIRGILQGKLETGYICRGGPGVKVILKDKGGKESTYVFSCQEPNKVCDILPVGQQSVSPLASSEADK